MRQRSRAKEVGGKRHRRISVTVVRQSLEKDVAHTCGSRRTICGRYRKLKELMEGMARAGSLTVTCAYQSVQDTTNAVPLH